MIHLKEVRKAYGVHQALQSVDLDVREGECVVLIGPSGCGKSTLLKSINRMVNIDAGDIRINGKAIAEYKPETLRRQMGYCIQGVGLFPHLSVRENIAVVPKLLKWQDAAIEARILHLMDLSGLPVGFLDKKPRELSGGEAQRVGVCRALAADPPILLMDEPFGAVDPLTREKLQLAFSHIQQELKKTVVFVTHDVEEAIVLGDRIAVMNSGKILSTAVPGAFARGDGDDFVKAFLGSEYPIKLLKRFTVKDLNMSAPSDFKSANLEQALNNKGQTMTEETTLKEILAELMQFKLSSIPVRRVNGQVDLVTYSHIVELLQVVSQNE